MMKKQQMKTLLQVIFAFSTVFIGSQAQAYRSWHHGWGWGIGAGVIGGGIVASQYPRPYYYTPYPPPVVYQQPIVIQPSPSYAQQIPPPVVAKPSIWYFCESENNFYPNVASCPEPWKPIQTDPSSAYIAPNAPPPTGSSN